MVAKEDAYKELGRRERREKQLRIAREKLEIKNQLMVSFLTKSSETLCIFLRKIGF